MIFCSWAGKAFAPKLAEIKHIVVEKPISALTFSSWKSCVDESINQIKIRKSRFFRIQTFSFSNNRTCILDEPFKKNNSFLPKLKSPFFEYITIPHFNRDEKIKCELTSLTGVKLHNNAIKLNSFFCNNGDVPRFFLSKKQQQICYFRTFLTYNIQLIEFYFHLRC